MGNLLTQTNAAGANWPDMRLIPGGYHLDEFGVRVEEGGALLDRDDLEEKIAVAWRNRDHEEVKRLDEKQDVLNLIQHEFNKHEIGLPGFYPAFVENSGGLKYWLHDSLKDFRNLELFGKLMDKLYESDRPSWRVRENGRPDQMDYLPEGFKVGPRGIVFEDRHGVPRRVSDTGYWLYGVTRSIDSNEAEMQIAWYSHGSKVEHDTLPMASLADKRTFTASLYARNITGFSSTARRTDKSIDMKDAGSNLEYLRQSVNVYNSKRGTEDAYSRLGWHGDNFVFGEDLFTPQGCRKANLSKIPAEIRSGISQSKGDDFEAWQRVTGQYLTGDKYWKHLFTLFAALGSPLLKLIGADGGILSLAGESGVGKTTAAMFGLSAYANPKSFEIAPQSTEKAFYERWKISQNLASIVNEASTIDIKAIERIVYAAANGEPRDTLTQKVELRDSNRFCLLNIFTSNNHLKGIDERYLNEACRRRIFELTFDTPLPQDVAAEMNRLCVENYGTVGRDFIEYVVEHRSAVEKRLREAYQWVLDMGVKPEDRHAAWIIATAKIASEIGDEIGFVFVRPDHCCLEAIEAVKSQSLETKTTDERVRELIADFINAHNGFFTTYSNKGFEMFDDNGTRGEIVGRINRDQNTIAISRKALANFGRERGIDPKQISDYRDRHKITETSVRLVPAGKGTRCLIIENDPTDSFDFASVLNADMIEANDSKPS